MIRLFILLFSVTAYSQNNSIQMEGSKVEELIENTNYVVSIGVVPSGIHDFDRIDPFIFLCTGFVVTSSLLEAQQKSLIVTLGKCEDSEHKNVLGVSTAYKVIGQLFFTLNGNMVVPSNYSSFVTNGFAKSPKMI